MNDSNIIALILAAGESGRMGSAKALLSLGEETVLGRSVSLFRNAGIRDIRIVIGCQGERIRSRHSGLPAQWIQNDQFRLGMFSSVAKGVATIGPDRSWFFLLPVDIPLVRPRTIYTLMEACIAAKQEVSILHPTFMGKRGHPPLIAASLIPDILEWNGSDGFRGFLDTRDAFSEEIAVIDEFIGRDMDTPSDYEALSNAFRRHHLPTSAECSAMLNNASLFSDKTASHCRKVADLAVYLGSQIAAHGTKIDLERIESAALLHDIAKGEPGHAAAGAALLFRFGFSGIADIVAAHMDIELPLSPLPTECELVYLADKLVEGDTLVPLAVRFENKLARHGHHPATRNAILKRWADADVIVKRIENTVLTPFQTLLTNFSRGCP